MVGNTAHSLLNEPIQTLDITNRDQSLDTFLRMWARHTPDAKAFSDPVNRSSVGSSTPLSLTFGEADLIVEDLARQFIDHGLKPGDVVALQIPNIVELPILILSILRAGLIPCPFPIHWRNRELDSALQMVPAKAMISPGEFNGHSHSQMMCDLAYDHMSIRYVYGIGDKQVDGVTSLNSFFSRDRNKVTRVYQSEIPGRKQDHPALVSWSVHPTMGLRPIYRTDRELMANGLMHIQELKLTSQDIILTPYPLTGLTGLVSTFLPSLMTGAHLVQHLPFNYDVFVKQVMAEKPTYTAVPAPILKALIQNEILTNTECSIKQIGCSWPTPLKRQQKALLKDSAPVPVFDILNLHEASVYISRRNLTEEQGQIKLGEKRSAGANGEDVRLLETRFKGRLSSSDGNKKYLGTLYVRGLSVPVGAGMPVKVSSENNGSQGWINTGVPCSIAQNANRMDRVIEEPDGDLIYHGGITFRTKELDALYRTFVGFEDAAVLAIPDPIMGERLCVIAKVVEILKPTLQDFAEFLTEAGVSPCKIPEKLFPVENVPRDKQGKLNKPEILRIIKKIYMSKP